MFPDKVVENDVEIKRVLNMYLIPITKNQKKVHDNSSSIIYFYIYIKKN